MRHPKQKKTRLEEYRVKYVPQSLKPCIWQYDEWHNNWETSCGNAHVFIIDGPRQNGYKYCPYCGGKLEMNEKIKGILKTGHKQEPRECSLCGAELTGKVYKARSGEEFCTRYHRDKSVRMMKNFLENVKA